MEMETDIHVFGDRGPDMVWLLLIASAGYSGELYTCHTKAEKKHSTPNALHACKKIIDPTNQLTIFH